MPVSLASASVSELRPEPSGRGFQAKNNYRNVRPLGTRRRPQVAIAGLKRADAKLRGLRQCRVSCRARQYNVNVVYQVKIVVCFDNDRSCGHCCMRQRKKMSNVIATPTYISLTRYLRKRVNKNRFTPCFSIIATSKHAKVWKRSRRQIAALHS